jgi:hypothetical protein
VMVLSTAVLAQAHVLCLCRVSHRPLVI